MDPRFIAEVESHDRLSTNRNLRSSRNHRRELSSNGRSWRRQHILELGEELLHLVEQDGNKDLLLDFNSVEFLSSAALNKLIILDKKVKVESRAN